MVIHDFDLVSEQIELDYYRSFCVRAALEVVVSATFESIDEVIVLISFSTLLLGPVLFLVSD